jgi:hypothetical protein
MPLPPTLRPSFVIRRKALREGIFGSSRFWKFVAYSILGRQLFKRFFGKQPQVVDVSVFKGAGHLMQIETLSPQGRRRGRRSTH